MSDLRRENLMTALDPFLKDMIKAVLVKKPDDPVPTMIEWLSGRLGLGGESEKEELRLLRQEVARLKASKTLGSEGESSASSGEDEVDDLLIQPKLNPQRHRSAISAEVYGFHNKKIAYVPKQVPKTPEQLENLSKILSNSFIFSTLDEKDKKIVLEAMEPHMVQKSQTVIREGDDGKEIFVVASGELKCFKVIDGETRFVKDYSAGDAFGELALLYNCPRAATIVAETDCELWTLDRECFNTIVKESAVKRRERYEEFLSKVDILKEMDPYERAQLADGLKSFAFREGETVIKEGDVADKFFIIEEGTAKAVKILDGQEVEVKKYADSEYFGELALVMNAPRAASIVATSDLKVVGLDRHSFKRLLGPLEEILKRNLSEYEAIIESMKQR